MSVGTYAQGYDRARDRMKALEAALRDVIETGNLLCRTCAETSAVERMAQETLAW